MHIFILARSSRLISNFPLRARIRAQTRRFTIARCAPVLDLSPTIQLCADRRVSNFSFAPDLSASRFSVRPHRTDGAWRSSLSRRSLTYRTPRPIVRTRWSSVLNARAVRLRWSPAAKPLDHCAGRRSPIAKLYVCAGPRSPSDPFACASLAVSPRLMDASLASIPEMTNKSPNTYFVALFPARRRGGYISVYSRVGCMKREIHGDAKKNGQRFTE